MFESVNVVNKQYEKLYYCIFFFSTNVVQKSYKLCTLTPGLVPRLVLLRGECSWN